MNVKNHLRLLSLAGAVTRTIVEAYGFLSAEAASVVAGVLPIHLRLEGILAKPSLNPRLGLISYFDHYIYRSEYHFKKKLHGAHKDDLRCFMTK